MDKRFASSPEPSRFRASRFRKALLALSLCFLLPLQAWAQAPVDLFSARPPAGSRSSKADALPANQEYPLDLNLDLLSSGVLATGLLVRCEPQPGIVVTARISRVRADVNGTLSMLAPLVDREHAFLSLSVSGGVALGDVTFPDERRRHAIRFDSATRRHVSRNVPDHELDELPPGPAVFPPPPSSPSRSAPLPASDPAPGDAGETIVDILIVYSPAAASWASSSGGGINNVVAQALNRAQLAMDNSAAGIVFRLVHSAQISYVESGSANTDLSRLRNASDGYMDDVHSLRNQYGADLVCLLLNISDTGGLGYALTSAFLPDGFPTWAFSLCRVQQVASGYTMVHEIGHNMGAGHHKAQNVQPGPQLYDYSAGWRWTGTNGLRFCSVMAYAPGSYYADGITHTQVGHFSSPNVSYAGTPTGDAADGDNARTLRATRALTAAYRNAIVAPFWFKAVPLDNRVMLRWENPIDCGFSSPTVLVRSATAAYPTNVSQGALVYQGAARQFVHTNLTPNQPLYYTIWLSDDGASFVEP